MTESGTAQGRRVRVLVVDDHPLFRMGLSLALTAEGFEVVGEAGDGEQAVQLARSAGAELVVMDVRMPGSDGIEACARLTAKPGGPVVVMLTTYDEPGVVNDARKAGAKAFLSKETAPKELARMLRRVVEEPDHDWMPQVALPELTPREAEALSLLGQGYSNKAIAKAMDVSPETVKDHLERVFAKLDVRDRLTAVKRANELGLLRRR
ncbi:MAG TPA: response regulator transcription factor [Trueperaceae bacterium]|nr:response regulator transcription factor [Trueperaceae bacterium]